MSIFSIAGIGIITAFSVVILRDARADIAMLVGLVGGIIIIISLVGYLGQTFSFLSEIAQATGINSQIFKILLKIVGIGYIADFSAGVVEESGSKALADKIIFGGKLLIFVASLPIVKMLMEIVTSLIK